MSPLLGCALTALLFTAQLFGTGAGRPLNGTHVLDRRVSNDVQLKMGRISKRSIVTVGNIYGQYAKTINILRQAGVIDDKNNWSKNVDYLVQLGNIVDYGDDGKKVYELFAKLRAQAAANNQGVVNILGIEEMKNIYGDWTGVTDNDLARWGDWSNRLAAFRSSTLMNQFQSEYHIAARVPLHPALGSGNVNYDGRRKNDFGFLDNAAIAFSNAGIAPGESRSRFPMSLNQVGQLVLDYYQGLKFPQVDENKPIAVQIEDVPGIWWGYRGGSPFKLPTGLPADGRNLLRSSTSPLLYEGWATGSDDSVCRQVDGVLRDTGSRRLVMASDGAEADVITRCDDKVIILQSPDPMKDATEIVAVRTEYIFAPRGRKTSKFEGTYEDQETITKFISTGESEVIATPNVVYNL